MVDTSDKINKILEMIRKGSYFTINRPRQYGKTTTLDLLNKALLRTDEYLPVMLSFEGVGTTLFSSHEDFSKTILRFIAREYNIKNSGLSELFVSKIDEVNNFNDLSDAITEILEQIPKKIVLLIDEVDRASSYDIFLNFLGLLRNKYLAARAERDTTFHSVVLVGVHDIKTLKQKIRPEEESQYNSPWNIAADFVVDMSFSVVEISTMLSDYVAETGNEIDVNTISERLHFWSNGYPFLVSRLCKIIDEYIIPNRKNKGWSVADVDEAVRQLLPESNALFDTMAKNLESNKEIFGFIESVILGLSEYAFELSNPVVNISHMHGFIIKKNGGGIKIHNRIFEDKLMSYFISKSKTTNNPTITHSSNFLYVKPDGRLDFDLVMSKFQQAVKENYVKRQFDKYLEIDLRLMFMMFLKPIINGFGFCFKEAQIGEEKRLDVVVVFKDEKFVVELKMWYNEQYHEQGKGQLKKYMELENINKGYMLIFCKDRDRAYNSCDEDGIMMYFV